MHGRILTCENPERRGLASPFRCPLCVGAVETISHLFLQCPYAISVWNAVLNRWGGVVGLPISIQGCFYKWESLYHGELNQKSGVRARWLKIPKLICRCLWNERNYRIFQEKTQPAWKKAIKIQALLGEVISISKIPSNKGTLTDKEKEWMRSLNPLAVNIVDFKKLEEWDIRMDNSQFEDWLKERKICKLFFDGASKGNPGKVSGGGVIINPDGNVKLEYC